MTEVLSIRGALVRHVVTGVSEQARLSAEASVTLAEASAVLAERDQRAAWRREDRYALDAEGPGPLVAPGRWTEAGDPDHSVNAQDGTRVRVTEDGAQPFEALHALACAQEWTVVHPVASCSCSGAEGPCVTHVVAPINRRGHVVTERKVRARRANVARATTAATSARQYGRSPLSAADRQALKRRRDREARAVAAGASLAEVQRERVAWLAQRAERSAEPEALSLALAEASASWDTDARQ